MHKTASLHGYSKTLEFLLRGARPLLDSKSSLAPESHKNPQFFHYRTDTNLETKDYEVVHKSAQYGGDLKPKPHNDIDVLSNVNNVKLSKAEIDMHLQNFSISNEEHKQDSSPLQNSDLPKEPNDAKDSKVLTTEGIVSKKREVTFSL